MKKTNHRQNHTYPRKVRLPTFDWWKLSLNVIYSTRHVVIHRYSPRCYVTVVWINQSNKVDFKKGMSSRNLSYRRKDDTYSIPSKCVAVATVLRYASVYSCMIQVESVPATLVPRKQVVLVTALLGLNQVLWLRRLGISGTGRWSNHFIKLGHKWTCIDIRVTNMSQCHTRTLSGHFAQWIWALLLHLQLKRQRIFGPYLPFVRDVAAYTI